MDKKNTVFDLLFALIATITVPMGLSGAGTTVRYTVAAGVGCCMGAVSMIGVELVERFVTLLEKYTEDELVIRAEKSLEKAKKLQKTGERTTLSADLNTDLLKSSMLALVRFVGNNSPLGVCKVIGDGMLRPRTKIVGGLGAAFAMYVMYYHPPIFGRPPARPRRRDGFDF